MSVHGGGGIPACIAGGIPACLATGLQGGAWSGGVLLRGSALEGVPGLGGSVSVHAGIPAPPPQEKQLLLQTVCIPLECILVHTMATTILPLLLS